MAAEPLDMVFATMSTILHEQGFNTAWIETQLAHVDKTVFAVLIITLNILMDAVKCFNGMPTIWIVWKMARM